MRASNCKECGEQTVFNVNLDEVCPECHTVVYQQIKHHRDIERRLVLGIAIGLVLIFLACLTANSQSKGEVYAYIIASDINEPQIVFKQVLKETGHLKCEFCSLNRNNLFGFRYNHKYLEFERWEDSVDYYERWQIRKGYKEGEDYYNFLARKWGAPNMENRYIPRLKQIKIN